MVWIIAICIVYLLIGAIASGVAGKRMGIDRSDDDDDSFGMYVFFIFLWPLPIVFAALYYAVITLAHFGDKIVEYYINTFRKPATEEKEKTDD